MKKLILSFIIIQLLIGSKALFGQSDTNIERVLLQTDRNIYVAGEQLFFSCYCFQNSSNRTLTCSKFAYVVLRNENNALISGICIKLENNMFSGCITLPDTLSTGKYQLVSYTNYMRNFGEKSFFTKEIIVANRFDKQLTNLFKNSTYLDSVDYSNDQVLTDNDKFQLKLTPEKSTFKKREKIRVSLEAIGIKPDEVAHLSVSVREVIKINLNLFTTSIESRHGAIKHIDSSRLDGNAAIINRSNSLNVSLSEMNGILLKGHLVDPNNQQNLLNVSLTLSFPDTSTNPQIKQLNKEKILKFILNDKNRNLSINLPENKKGLLVLDDKYVQSDTLAPIQFSDYLTYEENSKLQIENDLDKINKGNCAYLPEIDGIILKGRAVFRKTQRALPLATVYLSSPDTLANLQYTKTDLDGSFQFLLNGYYNNRNLIINLPENEDGYILIDDKFYLREPYIPSKLFSGSSVRGYLIKNQNIVEVQKMYKVEAKKDILIGEQHVQPPMVYPPFLNVVYPSDYVSLPDFVEISREILPLLKIRKYGSIYEARIFNLAKSEFLANDPLIFLDGVPINSINQIISLGTEKINRIETIGAQRFDGGRYYSGILAVFSKKLEITHINWQTPILNVKYVQLHPLSIMVSPNYSKISKIPDFRQLLYWQPSLTLKANEKKYFEFSASDNKGEFEINVEGIANNGELLNAKTTIKVGLNSN